MSRNSQIIDFEIQPAFDMTHFYAKQKLKDRMLFGM